MNSNLNFGLQQTNSKLNISHLTDVKFNAISDLWRLVTVSQEIHDGFLIVANAVSDDAAFGASSLLRFDWALGSFPGHNSFHITFN